MIFKFASITYILVVDKKTVYPNQTNNLDYFYKFMFEFFDM